jgi:hypothetical protein
MRDRVGEKILCVGRKERRSTTREIRSLSGMTGRDHRARRSGGFEQLIYRTYNICRMIRRLPPKSSTNVGTSEQRVAEKKLGV